MGLLFNAFVFIFYTTEGYGTAASTRVSNGAACAGKWVQGAWTCLAESEEPVGRLIIPSF